MPKVTVIMPSLNVAKYISACMDSVLAQTLQDIEILAIDAGSDDGTLEILQKYATIDGRIKVLHSDRKSYGYQLNMGIALAVGEYVGVVETDDKIMPDMFQTLYKSAIKTGADYVKGCAQSFMEITPEIIVSNRIICTSLAGVLERAINPQKYPKLFVTDRFLWLGIYRKDFIKKVKLNETPGAAFQDIGFMFQVISGADKAVYLDKDVYFYRQDNIGASSYNVRGFRYLTEEYAYVKQFLQGKGKEWYQAYYEKMLNQCSGRFRMMAVSGMFWEEAVSDIEIFKDKLAKAADSKLLNFEELADGTRKFSKLFLKDSRELYEYYVYELQQKKNKVCDLLKIADHHQVVIFGCGALGKFVHGLLESRLSGMAVAYCDNNSGLWNTKLQGLPVIAPEIAVRCYSNVIYVITGVKSAENMRRQLYGLGVSDTCIYVFQGPSDMALFQVK